MITERDFNVLSMLAHYFVMCRAQIQRLCFPDDQHGRVTRRRLQTLVDEKLIARHPSPVDMLSHGAIGPAYFPAKRGLEVLAEQTGDDRVLGVAAQQPQAHHLRHWLAITETHLMFDAAIRNQTMVSCP